MSGRGTARVLAKLETALSAGNFYEAHQMYRTLYFRYSGQEKYDECLELLNKGALKLIEHDQNSSAADLVLLLLQTLEKRSDISEEVADIWIQKLGNLIALMKSTTVERESIIAGSVKWSETALKSKNGTASLHKLIGQALWQEGNVTQARQHFLLSRDGTNCGEMLITLSKTTGLKSELDLFLAQFVFQQLCVLKEPLVADETFRTYTKNHPDIGREVPPFSLPLLNFLWFLLEFVINHKNLREASYTKLCEIYQPELDRDLDFAKYLEKIPTIYFRFTINTAEERTNTGLFGGGLFGGIFNNFFQGMDDDEFEDMGSPDSMTEILDRIHNPSDLD